MISATKVALGLLCEKASTGALSNDIKSKVTRIKEVEMGNDHFLRNIFPPTYN